MTKREAVIKFYKKHPDSHIRAMQWFDSWSHINNIVKEWDDDCIDSEYEELCDWMNGEKYLINSLKGKE